MVQLRGGDPQGAFFTYAKTGPPILPLVILAPINALTLF